MHSGKPLVKWVWTEQPPRLARLLAAGCADLREGALLSPSCPRAPTPNAAEASRASSRECGEQRLPAFTVFIVNSQQH